MRGSSGWFWFCSDSGLALGAPERLPPCIFALNQELVEHLAVLSLAYEYDGSARSFSTATLKARVGSGARPDGFVRLAEA